MPELETENDELRGKWFFDEVPIEKKAQFVEDKDFNFTDPLSNQNSCGKAEINLSKTFGTIETTHPYSSNLRCTWKVASKCEAVKWRFAHLRVEESNDAIYGDIGSVYSDEYEPKWWKCAFDHVQIFYGTKMSGERTARMCGNHDSDGEWMNSNAADLEVNFATDTITNDFGFTLEWKCEKPTRIHSFTFSFAKDTFSVSILLSLIIFFILCSKSWRKGHNL